MAEIEIFVLFEISYGTQTSSFLALKDHTSVFANFISLKYESCVLLIFLNARYAVLAVWMSFS